MEKKTEYFLFLLPNSYQIDPVISEIYANIIFKLLINTFCNPDVTMMW